MKRKVEELNDWRPEVRSLVHTVKKHGFAIVEADNGEEIVKASEGHDAIIECLVACDEARLRCTKDGKRASFFIILGNSPGELIADGSYQPELEGDWDKVLDEHSNRWEERKQPVKRGFYGPIAPGKGWCWHDHNAPVGTEVEVAS